MSVDPLGGRNAASLAAFVVDELAGLAADAQTLRGRVAAGDILQAVVLPSNGLTDLLDIGGLRVAAELPPALLPGQTISVAVTGFSDDRINVQILPDAAPTPSAAGRPFKAAALPNAALEQPAVPPLAGSALRRTAVPVAVAATVQAPGRQLPLGQAPRTLQSTLEPIEARLATARAAVPAGTAQAPPRAAAAALFRPPIAERSSAAAPAAPTASRPVLAPYADPATLLRAAHIAITPATLAAAKTVLQTPERLPALLATLDSALAGRGGPQAATLRTLVAFLARLEPQSPVLAAQIASFVDQVVTGREVKLAHVLGDYAAAQRASLPDVVAGPPVAPERFALHAAALDADLKTQLHSLSAALGSEGSDAAPEHTLTTVVSSTLAAIAAVQHGAASALADLPAGFAFALPIALPDGFAQARIRIDRDAPAARRALDGDDFHIGFVLETQHLGTVAIDVVTVGRSVTLAVRTEAERGRRAFGAALGGLTERLESLRYRVVKADAAVASPAAAAAATDGASGPAHTVAAQTTRLVDYDA